MWLGWQSTNATSAKASTQQVCHPFAQRDTPFHSLESIVTHTRAVPHSIHTLGIENNYSNSTLCSSNCEGEPWETWASDKQIAAFSSHSSSCCYDNLIIVCHGCAVVFLCYEFPFCERVGRRCANKKWCFLDKRLVSGWGRNDSSLRWATEGFVGDRSCPLNPFNS